MDMIGGWAYPSEQYEFVSWDDDIPNIWKNEHVPNHQPDYVWTMDEVWVKYGLKSGWTMVELWTII